MHFLSFWRTKAKVLKREPYLCIILIPNLYRQNSIQVHSLRTFRSTTFPSKYKTTVIPIYFKK